MELSGIGIDKMESTPCLTESGCHDEYWNQSVTIIYNKGSVNDLPTTTDWLIEYFTWMNKFI